MDIASLGVDPQHVALAQVVLEIELEAAKNGWDLPATAYALVPSKDLLAEGEELLPNLREQLETQVAANSEHLTAVAQPDLNLADLEETLAQLAWPEQVAGMAVCLERVSVPPQAEAEAPEDPQAALEFYANHPDREEFRLVAGATRTGKTWCALRSRKLDNPDSVAQGSDMFPDLTEALLATFAPDEA
ncbi:hypothetical protein BK816_02790 [Boudabousia tangfeifanii]|uniref:Uncharacterized protein n=1 Tax=Boudabousia tangfeifanii TaxID=1912795 RepID=A0A1D9MJK7_9ACTO|nr:PPA1309 family protein [Boudabousia tangfeifanii]AOZ72360.1 hypothetical protein BK816_02790 [Boudabousia tangfeifanii]